MQGEIWKQVSLFSLGNGLILELSGIDVIHIRFATMHRITNNDLLGIIVFPLCS